MVDTIALVGIAVGLSMDAFAVSVTNGAVQKKVTPSMALRMAGFFGFFQGFMPFLGWLIGKAGESFIGSIDHWIALHSAGLYRHSNDRGIPPQGRRQRTG